MGSLAVVTWNVLHRIHAVNWNEPAIEAHPVEEARIAAISARLAKGFAPAPAMICLQEVSGDQLASLRRTQAGQIFATSYPRMPRYRGAEAAPALRDPTEHLVTIVAGDVRARVSHEAVFPTDHGKGFHVVELDGFVVINTHVSYGDKHEAQCRQLAEHARIHAPRCVVVLGDFNADRETCVTHLGPDFTVAVLREPALATRPRTEPSSKSQTIDHVIVSNGRIVEAEVVSGDGLSDHNPVVARIESSRGTPSP